MNIYSVFVKGVAAPVAGVVVEMFHGNLLVEKAVSGEAVAFWDDLPVAGNFCELPR
jgi:hypothetical protein